MARYIDVEPLEDKLKEHIKKTESELMLGALSTFLRLLDITPTADTVPVTRCKDCMYSETDDMGFYYCVHDIIGGYGVTFDADTFCSYGERKDNE